MTNKIKVTQSSYEWTFLLLAYRNFFKWDEATKRKRFNRNEINGLIEAYHDLKAILPKLPLFGQFSHSISETHILLLYELLEWSKHSMLISMIGRDVSYDFVLMKECKFICVQNNLTEFLPKRLPRNLNR